MATRQLTVELPEAVFQRLARIAELTDQSLEALAVQSITSNLPPSSENAPPEIQTELFVMQTLPVQELLKVAHSHLPSTQQQRHLVLLEKNQTGLITAPDERQELRDLGKASDQLMLRKAYAWAILRWRGH
ncbi:hypothetical protein [Coleofasciculus sp. H7-2]|uniref:hypothetical protein n=1 Tax=Coleofasciculus sp. H7-2 TaxID=3351545 RepID=UPI00367070AC